LHPSDCTAVLNMKTGQRTEKAGKGRCDKLVECMKN